MSAKQADLFGGSEKGSRTQALIARYCELWKARYGRNPVITKRDSGIAKRLAADLGDQAVELLEAYFAMNSSFFQQKAFDLMTFENNLKPIQAYHDTGSKITQAQARQIDKRQTNVDAFRKLLEDEDG